MATSIQSNKSNDISNDESYARQLQREEYNRIKEESKNKRKEQLRMQIRTEPTLAQTSNNDDSDVIIIDDDDDNDLSAQSHTVPSAARTSHQRNDSDSHMSVDEELDTNMDEILARQLQEEFDKEFAANLRSRASTNSNTTNSRQGQQSNVRVETNRTERSQTRIPNGFDTDILYNLARSRNTRNIRDDEDDMFRLNSELTQMGQRVNHFSSRSASNRNNPETDLTAAFNFLNDREFLRDFFNENANDDLPVQTSGRNNTRTTTFNLNRQPNRTNSFSNSRTRGNSNAYNNSSTDSHRIQQQIILNGLPVLGLGLGRRRGGGLFNVFNFNGDRDFNSNDYENLLRLDEINSVKKGLKKNEIDSLPVFEFRENKEDSEENTCTICYEEYAKKDMIMALTCTHKFHKKCIKTWLQQSRQCPLCKKDAINGN